MFSEGKIQNLKHKTALASRAVSFRTTQWHGRRYAHSTFHIYMGAWELSNRVLTIFIKFS